MLWRWVQTKREQIRREVDEEHVAKRDGAGCLLDGCCLAGFLVDVTVVAVLAGGVAAIGVSTIPGFSN